MKRTLGTGEGGVLTCPFPTGTAICLVVDTRFFPCRKFSLSWCKGAVSKLSSGHYCLVAPRKTESSRSPQAADQ